MACQRSPLQSVTWLATLTVREVAGALDGSSRLAGLPLSLRLFPAVTSSVTRTRTQEAQVIIPTWVGKTSVQVEIVALIVKSERSLFSRSAGKCGLAYFGGGFFSWPTEGTFCCSVIIPLALGAEYAPCAGGLCLGCQNGGRQEGIVYFSPGGSSLLLQPAV